MKTGTIIGISVGVAAITTVGIVGYKKGWFGSSKNVAGNSLNSSTLSDNQINGWIAIIQDAINYQKNNNWSVINESPENRLKAAAYESMRIANTKSLNVVRAESLGLPTNWEGIYAAAIAIKSKLNFK